MSELINKCYDYIVEVTIKQGKLLDCRVLYGDGTRFKNNYKVFQATYNVIKETLNKK